MALSDYHPITVKRISDKFDEFNALYFDSELPKHKVTFEVTHYKRYFGQFSWHHCYSKPNAYGILRVTDYFPFSDHEFDCIMIHEMIHCWQWLNDVTDGHRYYFKMKAAEINRKTNYKYDIARCTALSLETRMKIEVTDTVKNMYKTPKRRCILSYLKDGKRNLAVLTEKNADYIFSWMNKRYPGCEIHTSDDEMFAKYTKSVSTVHGYFISESDYQKLVVPKFLT